MQLTNNDRDILYAKYFNEGLNIDEANKRMLDFEEYIDKMVVEMKTKGSREKTIINRVRKEFEKISNKVE